MADLPAGDAGSGWAAGPCALPTAPPCLPGHRALKVPHGEAAMRAAGSEERRGFFSEDYEIGEGNPGW